MSDVALRVQNLSKQYTIGAAKPRHDTLRDQIAHGVKRLLAASNAQRPCGRPAACLAFNARDILGAKGRLAAGSARRSPRHHRQKRRREKHAAEDTLANYGANLRSGRTVRARGKSVRGRNRFPPGAQRAGERLPERLDSGHDA